MPSKYPAALKAQLSNRGVAPDSFLDFIIAWARSAPDEIFAPNSEPDDVYAFLRPLLGPWDAQKLILHRKAAMLEAMRCHAGLESSWNWNEGVDATNKTSMANKTGQESGIFQMSFDSEAIEHNFMAPFAKAHGIGTVDAFIVAMKANHALDVEYYARLIRINLAWAGPYRFHKIDQYLSKAAVAAFIPLLS